VLSPVPELPVPELPAQSSLQQSQYYFLNSRSLLSSLQQASHSLSPQQLSLLKKLLQKLMMKQTH
jgi:hypothetical protein